MSDATIAMLCVAILAGSLAAIFWVQDRHTPSSRALAWTLGAIASLMLLGAFDEGSAPSVLKRLSIITLEGLGLLFGLEWGRRVATASAQRFRTALNVLLRIAQGMALLFCLMTLGYLMIAPEAAISDSDGLITTRGYEFAIFAPILGTAILLATIAVMLLLAARIDPAEAQRIRAMTFAAPFFLLALIFSHRYVPLLITSGLGVFMLGAVGYLMTMSRRAQFMGQFLAPELRDMARKQNALASAAAEQREISVVACDLRGFTAYAGAHPSAEVTALLEAYFAEVGQSAAAHRGTVKDHAGDGVLILVGAPLAVDQRAQRALAIAAAIREQVSALLQDKAPTVGVGVGIASGEATVGAVRGAGRLEYMAVGQVVNRATRLCDNAANREILLDEPTASLLPDRAALIMRETDQLKGLPQQPVFSLAPSPSLPATDSSRP